MMSSVEVHPTIRKRPLARRFVPGCILGWVGGLIAIFNCPGISGCIFRDQPVQATLLEKRDRLTQLQRERDALWDYSDEVMNTMPTNQFAALMEKVGELDDRIFEAELDVWEEGVKAANRSADPQQRSGSILWTLAGLGLAAVGLRGIYRSYQST